MFGKKRHVNSNSVLTEPIKIDISPKIPSLPKFPDKSLIDVRYILISPYVSAHIYWNPEIAEAVYDIEEPTLNEEEKQHLARVEEGMRELMSINLLIEKNSEAVIEYIDKTARLLITELGLKVTEESYRKIFYYMYRDFIGLNEIEPLLRDYFIEDIECNGVNTPLYVVHRLYRNLRTNIVHNDVNLLASFVEKLAQRCGRYISYASPLLDGTLPDGSLDYNEPIIYKENGIVKVSKIGKFIDKFYKEYVSNVPVKVNDIEVPCFNQETLKIEWKKADYVYRHKNKEELYKLNLEFGRSVVLTGAHSLFILTKNGIKAEKTSNINKDSYVVIPLKIPENKVVEEFNLAKGLAESKYHKKIVIENVPFNLFIEKKSEIKEYLEKNYKKAYQAYYEIRKKGILPIKLWKLLSGDMLRKCRIKTTSAVSIPTYLKVSKELLRLLGYYIAEGWTIAIKAHKKVQFCLNKNEKNLINDIKNCFKECFGLDIYIEPEKNNAVKLTINSLLVWLVLNDVLKVSHYAKTKEVPELVFNVKKELQEEFLKSWHAGDFGSTASKKLAEDISYLSLLDNKIVPFYDRIRESRIDGRNIKSYEYYTNFFSRKISNFPSMVPIGIINPLNETHMRFRNKEISRERLKKILEEIRYKRFINLDNAPEKFLKEWEKRGFLNNRTLTNKGKKLIEDINLVEKLINSDLGFVKVKNIEKIKSSSEYVYDVSVPNEENFVGGVGGVMCHNSRVNATYTTDVTSRGPTFTIRKFTKIPWTPVQLVSMNSLSPEMLAYFWILLQYKCNILVTGGTASGKTTLLNALAFFIPPEARVVSIEDSVTGDSKIIVKEKSKIKIMQIKELVSNYKNRDVEVLTLNKNFKIEFAKPSAFIKHRVKKDIYEIITSTGRTIKVTQDHSLFSLGKSGLVEIKPTELKELESFIGVPRTLPVNGQEIGEINLLEHLGVFDKDFLAGEPLARIFEKYKRKDFGVKKERYRWWKKRNIMPVNEFRKINFEFRKDELNKLIIKSKNKSSLPLLFKLDKKFLEFLGLWLGDGSYDKYNKNAVIVSNADEECRRLIKKIAEKLNLKISEMSDGGVSLRLHSTILYKFMKYVIKLDGYSNSKKIPEFIFNLANKQLKDFVRGYFSADGCVKRNEISCASQSYELLEDLQTIFLRLGIISRINDTKRKDKCINMSISSSENIQIFKEIGFLQDRKNKKLRFMNKKAHHTCSDVIPLSIKQLKEINDNGNIKLSWPYLQGMQNISRDYLQKIAAPNSFFNDISHSDILWVKVKKIRKLKSREIDVYDISIPETEKFICGNIILHNTRELNLPRENWLPSVARTGIGIGGIGEVDLFSLLKNSFRQNPDYVIVGEVRGKEAFVLFQGMASGHSSLSTMHADSVDTVIKRLETPPIELSPTLVNTLDAIAVMTHAVVNKQETRRLREIVEIVNVTPDGIALTNTPFKWNPASDRFFFKKDSKVFEKIVSRYGLSKEELMREFELRTRIIFELYKQKVFNFDDVQKIVNNYYKNPQQVIQKLGISKQEK